MIKIGITGGIGSGKTTVCRVFEILGIPVFYSDTVAREIMTSDPVLVQEMTAAFGTESYVPAGSLNTKYIAGIVFNDTTALNRLNSIVHPAVFRAFDAWLLKVPSHTPYVLKEAALLYESGSYKSCDRTVLVTAPQEIKLGRVMLRDQFSREQVQARMDKQMNDEEKIKLADAILVNDGIHPVIPQVIGLHRQFLQIKA